MTDDDLPDLPNIYAPIQCGHCFSSLDYDEGWTCEPCGLHWPDPNQYAEVRPVFLDEEAEPCGEEPERDPHEHSGFRFWYLPCNLPEGHKSNHHWPLEYEKLEVA
jgi:hypothetical protein